MSHFKRTSSLVLVAALMPSAADAGFRIKIKIKKPRITVGAIKVTLPKCGGDICKALDKAKNDIAAETRRAIRNTEEAVQAAGKLVERQAQIAGTVAEGAVERLREGKLIDAAWHVAYDPLRHSENNALLAVQESTILNTVAQVTASTLGGGAPGGAAYAAWLSYRQTGNLELAMRVGMITGAAAYSMASVGQIQSQGVDQALAKKAILSGAIAGAAVAAGGGDEEAIREALLRAGTMVVVQSVYDSVAHHRLDTRPSEGEAYCLLTPTGAPCSPETTAVYLKDSEGKIVYESRVINGEVRQVPVVKDITVLDHRRPHVGNVATVDQTDWNFERGRFMQAVSKIPGMNAMSVFHDQWSINFEMGAVTNVATIAPAVYFTYLGTDAAILQLIRETTIKPGRPAPFDEEKSNEVH